MQSVWTIHSAYCTSAPQFCSAEYSRVQSSIVEWIYCPHPCSVLVPEEEAEGGQGGQDEQGGHPPLQPRDYLHRSLCTVCTVHSVYSVYGVYSLYSEYSEYIIYSVYIVYSVYRV